MGMYVLLQVSNHELPFQRFSYLIGNHLQDIEFIIQKNTLKWSSQSPVFETNAPDHRVSVYGHFMGMVHNNMALHPEQAFNLLCSKIEDIHEYAKNVVGPCYIILELQDKVSIFSSCTSTGLFYTDEKNQTILTNSERGIYKQYGTVNNINEDQVLSHILSHQILLRTVPDTLFKNIQRCPPGSCYTKENDKGTWGLFIQKKTDQLAHAQSSKSFSEQLGNFENIIQATIKLYKNYYKNEKFILLKSGGIDSAALLAAAHSGELPLKEIRHIAYGTRKAPKQTQAGKIAEHFGYKIKYLPIKESNSEILQKIAEEGLGTIIGTHYMDYLDREADSTQNNIELSGQNMDTLYSLDNYSPNSLTYGIIKWSRTFKSAWKRTLLTKYIMNKKSLVRILLLKLIRPGKNHSNFNYICSMNADIKEHILPFSKPSNRAKSNSPEDIVLSKHRELRTKALMTQLDRIGLNVSQIEKLDGPALNHVTRLLRWCRTPQNVPLNYYNTGKSSNTIKLIPYTEGPLVNFFIDYQLGIMDTIFIKRLVNKFFKKSAGHSLEFFAKSTRTKAQIYKSFIYNILSLFIPLKFLRKLSKSNRKQSETNVKNIRVNNLNLLKTIANCEERYLSQFIKDSSGKSFIDDLYSLLEKSDQNTTLTPQQDMMICRLVNLDIFLHSTLSKKQKDCTDLDNYSLSTNAS